jgi:hypothetical protein
MNYLHALLIGIDCYLPNELPDGASYKSLKGCVRDITHVEAFLKRQFNLLSERIYKLTASNVDGSSEPSEPPEEWLTYDNIVRKFEEITEKAQPQDQVYIHNLAEGTTRNATEEGSFFVGAKGYVLLAACRPSEFAYEYPFNGKESNGALTYWLLDSLQNLSPDLTYKVIYDRINAKVHSKFTSQTPMLLGQGNSVVLGSDYASLQ